jgi:hypothetical protein
MENLKNQVVSFQIAKKLRELGFNMLVNYFYSQEGKLIPRILESGNESVAFEPNDFYENFNTIARYEVNGKYQTVFSAPLLSQFFDWIKKEHKIQMFPDYTYYDGFHYGYKWVKSNGEYGEIWKYNNGESPDGLDSINDATEYAIESILNKITEGICQIK